MVSTILAFLCRIILLITFIASNDEHVPSFYGLPGYSLVSLRAWESLLIPRDFNWIVNIPQTLISPLCSFATVSIEVWTWIERWTSDFYSWFVKKDYKTLQCDMNDDFIFPNTFYQNVQTVAPPSSFYDNNTVTRPTDTSIPQKDFNLCLLGVVVLLLVIVYFCCKENGEFSKKRKRNSAWNTQNGTSDKQQSSKSKIPNSNDEKYTQAKEGNGEQTRKHKQAHKEEDDEISEKHRDIGMQNQGGKRQTTAEPDTKRKRKHDLTCEDGKVKREEAGCKEAERQNSTVKRKRAVESEKQAKRRKEEESKQQAERRKQEESKQQAERRKQEESKQQAERRKQEEGKQQAERRKEEESKQQAERRKQEERQKRKQEMYRKFRAEVRKWMELGYNKPQCIPAGIPNLGNTCYLNSLLQVLSWTPLIGQQLAEQVTKSVEDEEMKDDLSHANLSAWLFLLLNKVHSSNSSNSTRMVHHDIPRTILQRARKLNDQFNGHQQQDSFEMYNTLISGLEDEARVLSFKQAGSRKLTENEILMCKSKVSRLVGGTFVTVWFYESCEHVELTFQRFTSVSVPVPDLPQPKTESMTGIDMQRKSIEQGVYQDIIEHLDNGNAGAQVSLSIHGQYESYERTEGQKIELDKWNLGEQSGTIDGKTTNASEANDCPTNETWCTGNEEKLTRTQNREEGMEFTETGDVRGKITSMEVDSTDDQAIRTGTMYSTAEKMEMMNKRTNVRSTCEGTTDIADLRLESPGNERYNQLQGVFPEHSCEEKQLKIIPHQPLDMMRKDPTDLERGLHELTEEEIWDEEVIGCRICHSPTARGKKTHKKLMIIGLPPIFVVHINKIEKDGFGGLRKIDKMVTYPKYLNVAPFCSSALQKYESGNTSLTWFKLFGVVSHSGSIYGGHYTAYVRTSSQNASAIRESFLLTAWIDPERIEDDIRKFWEDSSHRCNMSPSEPPQNTIDEEWYYVSDTMVQKCTERAATLDRNAFILMYERCC